MIENIRMNLNFIIIMICTLIAQESKLATLTKISADIICYCLRCHKNKSGNKWTLKFWPIVTYRIMLLDNPWQWSGPVPADNFSWLYNPHRFFRNFYLKNHDFPIFDESACLTKLIKTSIFWMPSLVVS